METIKRRAIWFIVGVTLFAISIILVERFAPFGVDRYIEIMILLALAIVTGIYARQTKIIADVTKQQAIDIEKQATASVKMAEEMREQRYSSARPVIEIEARGTKVVDISCTNIGVGPALNLRCWIEDEEHTGWRRGKTKVLCRMALGTGINNVAGKQIHTGIDGYTLHEGKGSGYVRAQYEDAFGRTYESCFISSTKAAPELKYGEVKNKNDIVII